MTLPTKFKNICPIIEATIADIIGDYERICLVSMSEADLIIAAAVVADHRAGWSFVDTKRVDSFMAKRYKTTVKRLENVFPGSWLELQDDNSYQVRIPAEVLNPA